MQFHFNTRETRGPDQHDGVSAFKVPVRSTMNARLFARSRPQDVTLRLKAFRAMFAQEINALWRCGEY
jgi:hypothetical protein